MNGLIVSLNVPNTVMGQSIQKFAIERRFSCSPFDRNAVTMVGGCGPGVAKIQYSFDRTDNEKGLGPVQQNLVNPARSGRKQR